MVGDELSPELVALERLEPSVVLEPEPEVAEAELLLLLLLSLLLSLLLLPVVLAEGAAVDDGTVVPLAVLLVEVFGFWAPQGLLTRHAVWQAESWGAHAATHWFPYSVHSKYGIVCE